jgi:uncharacterized protein (TIGR03437 family)
MVSRLSIGWIALLFAILVTAQASYGQMDSLVLSSGTAGANGSISLNLTITSPAGDEPTAVQWTFTFPPSDLVSISASAGQAATNAGKTLSCASNSGTYTCLASGLNANIISNGTLAVVSVTLASGVTSTSIGVSNALGALASGTGLAVAATSGIVTGASPATVLTSVACSPTSLNTSGTATCTVTLSGAAAAGGTAVAISSNDVLLAVPASVTVPAAATRASFTATAGTISSNQNAVVTATLNGTSQTSTLSLVSPVLVSSLACNPSSLGPISLSACTVTLSKAAPLGGALVTLSNTALLVLTVPTSVTIPAGSSSAVFNAVTVSILSDQSATITATYNGSSKSVTIGLVASVVQISSLACPASLGPNASGSCTVTLTKAAPTGGAAVTLANSDTVLTVPASVTVAAGLTSATFSATTASIASNQSATITATYNGSSKSVTVSLTAPVLVSSLACPANLGSNASGSCTVTLTKAAPAGGVAVAISDNSATLVSPTSVTVAVGSLAAVFTVTTGVIPSDQSATVTATWNGSAKSATIGLVAGVALSSLTCNPTSLDSHASSTCVVTLTKAASIGGAVVGLSSNDALLPTAASVTVPSGATAATFTVTAGTIAADQTATVTATLSGLSRPVTINLLAPVLVSALACNPTSLGPAAATTCMVTLSRAASAGGAVVALSSNNPLLTTPISVTVPAGATTAPFTATSGSITVSQTGSVTTTYNGSSRSVVISLVPAVQVTSLLCNPISLLSAATTTCTVTVSQTVTANVLVSLKSNSPLIIIPAGVTVPAGSRSAGFDATTGTITGDTSGVITATLGATSQTVTLALFSTPTLTSLICSPTALTLGATSTCTVKLSKATGAVTVGLSSNDPALVTPHSVTVPAGAAAGTVTVSAQGTAKGWVILTATLSGVTKHVIFTIATTPANPQQLTSVRPNSISCTPRTLPAGETGLCQINLDGVTDSSTAELQLFSSSDSVKLPATISTRPGQSSVQFQVDVAPVPSDQSAVITTRLGAAVAQATVMIGEGRRSRSGATGHRLVKYGSEVSFSVFRSDPGASLSVTSLPPGASFDAGSGTFDWIPTAAQMGTYEVTFDALSPAGELMTEHVALEVDSGAPAITTVTNAASHSQEAACSPGAIGRLEGRWLSGESAASDASGNSLQLAGTSVIVNGEAVPILFASATRIDFLCPNSVPGSQLQIAVETSGGRSQAAETTAREVAPGIFSIDGSDTGQGMVTNAGGSSLVMVRNYRYAAEPAQPGDVVSLYATGIDGVSKMSVRIGSTELEPDSMNPVPELPGLWRLLVTVPGGESGNAVEVSVTGRMSNGVSVPSNKIRIAIEAANR